MESNKILGRVGDWSEEPGHNQEKEKQLEVLNLFELSEEQKEKLRNAVKAAGDRIILMVHPFFREGSANAKKVVSSEQYEKAKSRLTRLKFKESLPPFVILEEQGEIYLLEGYLASFLGKAATGEFYVVPTYPGDPEPNCFLINDPRNWQKLIENLKNIGVKKVFLAGMFLKPDLQGCVGIVARKLANDFQEIKVSSLFTMPETGANVRKEEKKFDMKVLPPYTFE